MAQGSLFLVAWASWGVYGYSQGFSGEEASNECGVVEKGDFSQTYTTGLGYRPTCDYVLVNEIPAVVLVGCNCIFAKNWHHSVNDYRVRTSPFYLQEECRWLCSGKVCILLWIKQWFCSFYRATLCIARSYSHRKSVCCTYRWVFTRRLTSITTRRLQHHFLWINS